jgi:hypothetical protein
VSPALLNTAEEAFVVEEKKVVLASTMPEAVMRARVADPAAKLLAARPR